MVAIPQNEMEWAWSKERDIDDHSHTTGLPPRPPLALTVGTTHGVCRARSLLGGAEKRGVAPP